MAQPMHQPDIGYYPDFAKYEFRSQLRARSEDLETRVPSKCPVQIESEFAWNKTIAADEGRWLFHLDSKQIEEISAALHKFKTLGLTLNHVCRETFILPSYGQTLRAYSRQLHEGIGFFLIRGFPIEDFSREEQIIIFAGLASYIGDTRARQDQSGAAISHVTDLTPVYRAAVGNPAFTAGPQAMHTDPGPIIGMLCLGTAAKGGESIIASSSTVYNGIARQKPYLIRTLLEPWCFDGFGGTLSGLHDFNPAIVNVVVQLPGSVSVSTKLKTHYAICPSSLHGLPRRTSDGFDPPITEAQAEALDAIHFTGLENSIKIRFEKGDFQFLNNLALLHARDEFQDGPGQKRHLLRMWLRDTEYGWDIPDALSQTKQWQRLWELDMKNQWFPLDPVVKSEKFTANGEK